MRERYESAKEIYKQHGVDTDQAIKTLLEIPISMHCWQGDDVAGFENNDGLSGGIQVTGNYPGKATNPEELMMDIKKVFSLVPGAHRINLHASYAIFEDGFADRDQLEPKHFKKWVEFAKENNLGIDFNPTYYAHKLSETATLSHVDDEIRTFWINHGKACIRISEYFAKELGTPTTMNTWIPDGFKDIPADRYSPRKRLKESLDEILSMDYDKDLVNISVESKVFGIGLESYTVGSHEFYMNYAAKNDILCLLDNGHFHPTETVSDKISSMLLFFEKVALHVTRPVRWDSDHVVLLSDEIKEIAKEIIMNGHERFIIGLDFFDATINRVAAWVIGMRNMQKALLYALLTPHNELASHQKDGNLTELLMLNEEVKLLPFGDVWAELCNQSGIEPSKKWFDEIKEYEELVTSKRGK